VSRSLSGTRGGSDFVKAKTDAKNSHRLAW
jgi:hypothetical protein